MHKSGYAIVVTGLLTVLMISYSVSHAGQSEALIDAAKRGDLRQVQHLLDRGADVNAKDRWGNTRLMSASFGGHTELVRFLLQKGADINAKTKDGSTALSHAASKGHLGTVQLLLEKGANVRNEDGLAPAEKAIFHPEVVKTLTDAGAEVTLIVAACLGDLAKARELIIQGADVNAKGWYGQTPLTIAACWGHLEVVRLLLD